MTFSEEACRIIDRLEEVCYSCKNDQCWLDDKHLVGYSGGDRFYYRDYNNINGEDYGPLKLEEVKILVRRWKI